MESIGDSLFPELGTDELDVQSYDVRLGYDPSTQVIDADLIPVLANVLLFEDQRPDVRHLRQARNPARSASSHEAWNVTFSRFGRPGQEGQQ